MRIKRVECDQFAGLTGKELEFDKGLNIVIGENESGKSTIVDLIYQLLFKDVKLDGRSDSAFIDRYFPKKVSGPQGDVIDGVLVFETEAGTYKLKKEWEKGEGTCRLILPDGTSIKGNEAINRILSEELKHRAGVYNEIVFASQKRDHIAVESIMRSLEKKTDQFSDTRSDFASTLTQAALETGGVSIEKIEKTIKKNLNDLTGRWDLTADAPEGGAKRASYRNAWSNGAGAIVKAYYEADEVRSKQEDAEKAECAVEEEKADLQKLHAEKKELDNKRADFQKYIGLMGQRSLLSNTLEDSEKKIGEQKKALENWPKLISNISKAGVLQNKLRQAQDRELFLKAEPVYRSYQDEKAKIEKLKEVEADDLKNLREFLSRKQKSEGKLTGIDLIARVKKLGQEEINITSIASDEVLDLNEGEVQIREAVSISIPGIMDMQLIPQGVDVDSVKQELASLESEIKKIDEKYGVNSLGELQEMADAYSEATREVERTKMNLKMILGDSSWEDVKSANASVPVEIETEAEIRKQISDLCGLKTVDAFIGGLEATLFDYQEKYVSAEELKSSIEKLEKEEKANKQKLDSMDEIPEEYLGIDDPDQYDADFQTEIDNYEKEIGDHNEKLNEAVRYLGDKSAEEYSEELRDKEKALNALKTEYEHWLNIYDVFCRLKDQNKGNPIEDIENRFREYLGEITDGSLKLDSMDEHMTVQLASGPHALTYDILSDGTKDTISLAFRLAMLEHLYPEGDGIAVFDDPFTDMDPKRVEQSCRLIQKYAENNQVVFVTCDDKYKEYLDGNIISV